MFSRKRVFITGLIGVRRSLRPRRCGDPRSGMLVTARPRCRAHSARLLAPAALGTLVSTFRDPGERGRAFRHLRCRSAGGGGGPSGPDPGWRSHRVPVPGAGPCMSNLIFAAIAVARARLGYMRTSKGRRAARGSTGQGRCWPASGLFCIVFGFSPCRDTAGWAAAPDRGVAGCRPGPARRLRLRRAARQPPAAAAAGDPGPHPRRCALPVRRRAWPALPSSASSCS